MEENIKSNSIVAIRDHYESESKSNALLASSILLNSKSEKRYTIAKLGELLPIVYDSAEVGAPFMRHIAQAAVKGYDLEYQPPLRFGANIGCKVLYYSDNPFTPAPTGNEITRLDLPTDLGAYERCNRIGEQAKESGAKVLIIENCKEFVGDDPKEMLTLLGALAHTMQILIIAGFKVSEDSAPLNEYLFMYAHNLCLLIRNYIETHSDDGEPKVTRFFSFKYGLHSPNFLVYAIDENGKVYVPADIGHLLLMRALGGLFARQPISLQLFSNRVFGFLQKKKKKTSVDRMISTACEMGILHKSGTAGKTNICITGTDTKAFQKPYSGNVAITALGNRYSSTTKHTPKRKAILKHGEFKLLSHAFGYNESIVKKLTIQLIEAVATGLPTLDFQIKTKHRNILLVMLADDKAEKRMRENVGKKAVGANFDIITIDREITDADLLYLIREGVNSFKPDFVFLLNLDKVAPSAYTPAQFGKELSITAKSKGLCIIAQTSQANAGEIFDFDGDQYWCVSPMIREVDRMELEEMHDIYLPQIYSFKCVQDGFDFLCRFGYGVDGKLIPIKAKEQLREYLIATFGYCHNRCYDDIIEDCTGKVFTKSALNSALYRAQKMGLVRVDYINGLPRAYKNCSVTFIGGKK